MTLKTYGLTLADFDAMVVAQNGLCAICQTAMAGKIEIDHCHATERVRGLLCGYCNRGIGHFQDNPLLLMAAAKYLEQTREWRKRVSRRS